MRILALGFVAALSVPLATAADDDKDLKKIQGDWQVISVTGNGTTITGDALKGMTWRFEGTRLTKLNNDYVATITLDSTTKPATANIGNKHDLMEAIYKFSGDDKLTICTRGDSQWFSRPKSFDASKGSFAILLELERVKK